MNAFRAAGLTLGQLPPGPRTTLADVPGIYVGHVTLTSGQGEEAVRTGVTAIVPPGDPYAEPLAAGLFVLHGHGKAVGLSQVRDLGELETPVLITNTLAVFRCAEALLSWTLRRHPEARSVNPVVLECNDGRISAIERRPVTEDHALAALEAAGEGVEEGCVGAGTGMVAFGFKSGVGTASRRVGDFTVGVLAVPNMGRAQDFRAPFSFEKAPEREAGAEAGSLVVVLATTAPLLPEQLSRLARRAALGAARTGAPVDTGSGDFFLAFSTGLRFPRMEERRSVTYVPDRSKTMGLLYRAAAEASEEAIFSGLLAAKPTPGRTGQVFPALRTYPK